MKPNLAWKRNTAVGMMRYGRTGGLWHEQTGVMDYAIYLDEETSTPFGVLTRKPNHAWPPCLIIR